MDLEFGRQTDVTTSPAELLSSGHHPRHILDRLPVAIYMTDAAGRITYFNAAAAVLWGCAPELGSAQFCGSWKLYWPDGTPLAHDQCPMALALKRREAIRGMEAMAERPDGTRVRFLPYPTPLFDGSGALTGAVNMLVDVTALHRAEDRLRESEHAAQRLASIVESAEDAIVSKSLDGVILTWNRGAERLFGYTAAEAIGQPVTMLIPSERHNEEPEILRRIRRGERIDHYDAVRQRKDGTLVPISLTVSPIFNERGEVVGASKIARDISERKRAEETQALLLREMNHRVKNLFALVGSLLSLSTRFATTPQELADAVRERLAALARAHALTLPDHAKDAPTDRSTTLHALVQTISSPHLAPDGCGGRFSIGGPDLRVGQNAVTGLALLLHEFATNAAKYGSLSSTSGRVTVGWIIEQNELSLTWREDGGPPITGETRSEGFGSLLARSTLAQFGGRIERDWRPEGLAVQLSIPVESLRN
jgi:PAS domain S-box-containing protein